MSGEERRRSPRASACCLLGYARRLDAARFAILGIGSTLDVSTGGIRFLAYELIPERSRLELELVLDGRLARIEEARVVRALSRRDGTCEIAARFERAPHTARLTIQGFVEERLAQERAGPDRRVA